MGYFDEAKASRDEENSLEHSSGPWKKHKYLKKIGKVYYYAKKSSEYWKDALQREKDANDIAAEKGASIFSNTKPIHDNVTKEGYDKARKDRDLYLRRSSEYGHMALNEAEKLLGKRGGKILHNLIEKYADVKVKNESYSKEKERRKKLENFDREGHQAKKKYDYIHLKNGKYYSYSKDRSK